jgi:diguanylate cyclase (GGDEF)-like protein
VHGCTTEEPLERPLGATLALFGGRLAAALLPLAALAALHLVPSAAKGTPLPWVAPGVAAIASAATGVAMLIAVTAALSAGRLRDHADSVGMGMVAVAFAVVALGSTGGLGLGAGLVMGAAAFAAGSAAGVRLVATLRERTVAVVITLAFVEAGLAVILLIGPGPADDRLAVIPLIGAAILLAIAAITTFDEPARATALGIAASSVLAMALAAPTDAERFVGPVGIAVAAVVAYWSVALLRLRRSAAPEAALEVEEADHPEYDELSRLTRELRATIDELIGARRTIELQRLEIERASTIDPLTGLPGRGPTLERLRTDAAEARRYAHPVAVILLDIDGFAELNHQNGLPVGDAILREMALRLRLRIRAADALGRVGGDSFLAILPHTDEQGATNFARAVIDRMMERNFATERGDITVRVSIGVALMAPGMTIAGEDLLAAAEEALQAAKVAGGNRIAFDRVLGVARLDARESRGGEVVDETG